MTLESLLFRHFGAAESQGWTTQGHADFFKKSAETMVNGRFQWETVRALMVQTLTVQKIREQTKKVQSKSLPLAVWVQLGYTKQQVLQFPSEKDSILGEVYAIRVEEEISEKERAAKSKGKRKADDGEDWDIVQETKPAKASKAQKELSGKDAAKAEEK